MVYGETTVVIDLMGVIFREGQYVTKLLYPLVKKKISYHEFKKRYILFAIGNITREEFWDGLVPTETARSFETHFLTHLALNKNTAIILKKLAKDNRLILFSEMPTVWGQSLLKHARLRQYFSTVIFSGDVGSTKPFKTMFLALMRNVKRDANKYFVDDSLENILTAKKYGFITVHYHQWNCARPREIDHTTTSLNQLEHIINYSPKVSYYGKK